MTACRVNDNMSVRVWIYFHCTRRWHTRPERCAGFVRFATCRLLLILSTKQNFSVSTVASVFSIYSRAKHLSWFSPWETNSSINCTFCRKWFGNWQKCFVLSLFISSQKVFIDVAVKKTTLLAKIPKKKNRATEEETSADVWESSVASWFMCCTLLIMLSLWWWSWNEHSFTGSDNKDVWMDFVQQSPDEGGPCECYLV